MERGGAAVLVGLGRHVGSSKLAAGRALLDDLDQRDDLVTRDPVGQLRMVAAEMLQREIDELILGLAADDLAALACDLPGHGWVSKRLSGPGLSRMLAETLERGWSAATTPTCSSAGASSSSSMAAASNSASPAGRVACSLRTSCSNGRARSAAMS